MAALFSGNPKRARLPAAALKAVRSKWRCSALTTPEPALYKKESVLRDMAVCGVAGLAAPRIVVEVIDIAGNCFYGHSTGDTFDIDPFQVNGMCGLLYNQLYPYMHVLLSGATLFPGYCSAQHCR